MQSKGPYLVAGDKLGETYILKFRNFLMGPGVCIYPNITKKICLSCGERIENKEEMIGSCKNCNREFRYIKDRFGKPEFTLKDIFITTRPNVTDEISTKEIRLEKLQEKLNGKEWKKTALLWAIQYLQELYL